MKDKLRWKCSSICTLYTRHIPLLCCGKATRRKQQVSAVTYAESGRQPAWGSTLRTPGAGGQPVGFLYYENTDSSLNVGLFTSCEADNMPGEFYGKREVFHKHLKRDSVTKDRWTSHTGNTAENCSLLGRLCNTLQQWFWKLRGSYVWRTNGSGPGFLTVFFQTKSLVIIFTKGRHDHSHPSPPGIESRPFHRRHFS